MKTGIVNSAWTVDGEGVQVPEISVDYPNIDYSDMAGQDVDLSSSPDPNVCAFHIICTDQDGTNIENDPKYDVLTDGGLLFDILSGESASRIITDWLGDRGASFVEYEEE